MASDRLATFHSDIDLTPLSPIQRLLFEAHANELCYTISTDGTVEPTSVASANLKVLVLGYDSACIDALTTQLGPDAELITVGPHPECLHNIQVAHWFQPYSSTEAKSDLLCWLYDKFHFDLVWVNPTEIERGGNSPEFTKDAVLECALHYIVQFEPTHFVINRSTPALCNSLNSSQYNISGFPDRTPPHRNPKYTIQGKSVVDPTNATWWTNIPVKFTSNPDSSYTQAVTDILSATVTNQHYVAVSDADERGQL